MRNVLLPAAACGVLVLSTACGDGGGGTGATGASGTGGNHTSAQCPESLVGAPGSDFCAAQATTPNCSLVGPAFDTQVCGVPVLAPTTELARSSNVKEYGGTGAPDLGCFEPAGYPTLGQSQTVTMSGLVKIFSHGCESKNVEIEVYEAVDADLGPKIGSTVITPSACDVEVENDDCSPRLLCKYSYPGVPTEKELIILTKGMFWAPLYDFNVYIPNSDVKNGVWEHNVRALATDDYTVIPQAAIGGPITPGNGAIAGEVHDCGDVRLTGATVDVEVKRRVLTYFSDDEDAPLPNTGATSTSVLGLYAALDVAPGKASVAAIGLVGGKVTTVGYHRVTVFPDAVTSITFRGARPFQVEP